jgi:hypothetical protein
VPTSCHATSSFLFSVNRLNVAISRAQALIVVRDMPCRTIEQMRWVNVLAAVKEHADAESDKATNLDSSDQTRRPRGSR